MTRRPLPCWLPAAVALLARLSAAAADEAAAGEVAATAAASKATAATAEGQGEVGPAGAWRVAVLGLAMPSFDLHEGGGPRAGGGGGLSLRWAGGGVVLVGAIVRAIALPAEGALQLPIDLVVDVPFEVGRRVRLYLGVGLTASVTLFPAAPEERARIAIGVRAAAGCEYWIRPRVAMFAELNLGYLRALAEDRSVLQPQGAAGVLFALGR